MRFRRWIFSFLNCRAMGEYADDAMGGAYWSGEDDEDFDFFYRTRPRVPYSRPSNKTIFRRFAGMEFPNVAHNPDRTTCPCGKGKVSAWDGKCGHCRTKAEARELGRMHHAALDKKIDYDQF